MTKHPMESAGVRQRMGLGFVPAHPIDEEDERPGWRRPALLPLQNQQAIHLQIAFVEEDDHEINLTKFWLEGVLYIGSKDEVWFYRHDSYLEGPGFSPQLVSGILNDQLYVQCNNIQGKWAFKGDYGTVVDPQEFFGLNPEPEIVGPWAPLRWGFAVNGG